MEQHSIDLDAPVGENLEEDEDPAEVEKETEQFVEELKEGKSNILVAVRVRGLLPAERHVGGRAILRVLDRKVVVVMDPGITAADDYLRLNKSKEKRYAFDYVFDENCGQTEVTSCSRRNQMRVHGEELLSLLTNISDFNVYNTN